MNVLSLFDGISCGRQALHEIGIKPDNYFSFEIDTHALKISKSNWEDITQLGDVLGWRGHKLPKIDLLLGGFPCQSFSFAGKGLNFEDSRGKLFFTLLEILKEVEPKNYLIENVNMRKIWRNTISEGIGLSRF